MTAQKGWGRRRGFAQASYEKNFKFLPIQEVAHLLTVFDASLKEAKMTFLIPERMILFNFHQ